MKQACFILAMVFLAGCSQLSTENNPLAVHVEEKVIDSLLLDAQSLYAPSLVREFYRRRNFRPAWQDTSGFLPHADSLIAFVRKAAWYGLDPNHYRRVHFDGKIASEDLADIHLTDTYLALTAHLQHGRVDPRTLLPVDVDDIADSLILVELDRNLDADVLLSLQALEPAHKPYHDLKAALHSELADTTVNHHVRRRRVESVHVNMERWRWEKRPLPPRYISVNTPSFMLKVVEGDSVVLESRVIVGRKETPTPELRSVIRTFIIYPYWHVPRSILPEILPNIQADSTYMARRNYQVLGYDGKLIDPKTLDWSSYTAENFPYTLRQREGDENTMGVLKFVFANNYNVYLHDTNARGLFARTNRALSHGCVRVQRAVDLARYLAKDDDTYVGPEDLDQYLQVKAKLTVKVVKPIPVLLEYFTASVHNGKLFVYDDIYDKDRDILSALYHLELHASVDSAAPAM